MDAEITPLLKVRMGCSWMFLLPKLDSQAKICYPWHLTMTSANLSLKGREKYGPFRHSPKITQQFSSHRKLEGITVIFENI